jgi:cytochrome c-type biogenesis protein CcmF
MLREYIGSIGHFSVIISFVSALFAMYSYWIASKNLENNGKFWLKTARISFGIHSIGIFAVVLSLFTIIFNHYFEYHYAWDNSSLSLPLGYAISCFWQDQEGSFLLWMFWDVILGLLLIAYFNRKSAKLASMDFESPMMTIFSGVQVFLSSMILGLVIYGDFKLGSSPFLLLKESMPDLPVWQMKPNFIPEDGNGLNPLLQNYWMVIHPPTLFLGFAATLIPFSFAIAALWKKQYTKWINIALPWTLMATVVLGTGIMMGGIWAYETLNFGGYWNWDPVENAVYVPWLILVGSFHTMILAKRSSSALKFTFVLVILQFILILYSTFLTRSGILGNASVHSFTDLGLSGQLLIYLFTFIGIALILTTVRWKELPRDEKEIATYTPEFWVLIGVLILGLAAFQVILTTSIPVYNKIAEVFGVKLNMALPANQIKHYTNFQMWLFIPILGLTGVAQFYWWKKIKGKDLNGLINPLILTLLLSSILITFTEVHDWKYIILLTVGLFSINANLFILFDFIKGNFKVVGGAVTHIGVAMMLIGIMYSSAYEKVISLNNTGEEIFANSKKDSKENVILYLNRPNNLGNFELDYKGKFVDVRNAPGYIEKRFIQPILGSTYKGKALADIVDGDKTFFKKGDTVEYEAENTYYQVSYHDKNKDTFNLYPRYQINAKMGNVASPDIKKFWNKDIYTHVNYIFSDEDREWSVPENYGVALKDTFFMNDYVAILDDIRAINEVDGIPLNDGDAAAQATLRILERDGERILKPLFVIKNKEIWSKPVISNELGIRVQLTKIDPTTGLFDFTISRGQKDYIILKAIEKPGINLLWIGMALLVIGICIAALRRFRISEKI